MENKLTKAEKNYIRVVVSELRRFDIDKHAVDEVKQQIIEHIQECHINNEDSLRELGSPKDFVANYVEVNEINPILQVKDKRKKTFTSIISIIFSFLITFVMCQFLFSMFLTTSSHSNDFNLLYHISDHVWWNSLLLCMSFSTSIIVTSLVYVIFRKHNKKETLRSV
ncbi:hypothetical protein QUF99_17400 [Bacillus sp. DX4.1]|uniref:hypothetical protein n=1 Tax=Bacillus sp. DX4.1 TaxID=3055867 RepID=UPI0025A2E7CB|nr:hypothetical protein [Bacillus sp. DX4.1]MDM5189030.1 hypothetical protein [Bacillus sp. DX4.1]